MLRFILLLSYLLLKIPRQRLKPRSQGGVVWTYSVFDKIHRCLFNIKETH